MSEHPILGISLKTRTRSIGTLNLALALRGQSTGWGNGGRPRRTFIGFHRINRNGGQHFIEAVIWRGPDHHIVWNRRISLDRRPFRIRNRNGE